MATPIANFSMGFTAGSLTVVFTDTSTDGPTSWLWDFGDGSPQLTTQGPHSITYATSGQYSVKLTATNVDGSTSLTREITVSDTTTLPFSLKQIAKNKLLGLPYDEEALDSYIAQWQLYVQPVVTPTVSAGDVFNENAYAPLANVLVAYLAAYSVMKDIMMQLMVGSSNSSNTSTSSGTTNQSSGGALKSIETGPSKAEWYDTTDKVTAFFKSSGGASSGTGSAGPIDVLQQEICIFADRVGVRLDMCPIRKHGPTLFVKSGPTENTLWPATADSFTLNL